MGEGIHGRDTGLCVAVDARPLMTSRAGVATYCRGLVYGLDRQARDERILLYAKGPAPGLPLAAAVRWRAMDQPLWLPVAVPRALAAGRVDVFHGTNHMAPPLSPVPTVITVHDMSLLTTTRRHTWRNRLLTLPQMLLSVWRAARLVADSEFVARGLARLPGIHPERIRVIPLAPAPELAPATPAAVREFMARAQLPSTFFLYVGTLGPNKNVATLVRAFRQLRAVGREAEGDAANAHLVIAGVPTAHGADVHHEVRRLGLQELVHFVGYVAAEDLPALYGAATAFVFPSLSEGFGLPPLEAMACGAPVICSNTSSLPEVVGEAALLVDPHTANDLAAAMRRVLDEPDVRTRLRTAGLARAGLFSWDRTARETLAVYHEAAHTGSGSVALMAAGGRGQ